MNQTQNQAIVEAAMLSSGFDPAPKRKYTKGAKWKAHIKRLRAGKKGNNVKNKKQKHLAVAQAGFEYIEYLGSGNHHLLNTKKSRKEVWRFTEKPTADAMKNKNHFIEFAFVCLPKMEGINA